MLRPVLDLFRDLGARGAVLERTDGNLRVTAPAGVLTEDLKNRIAAHKTDILDAITDAVDLLNRHGVRLITDRGRIAIGVWRDADVVAIREALEVVGLRDAEVVYLDDPDADVPERYRAHRPNCIGNL